MGFCRCKCQRSEYIFYLLGFKASSDSGEIAPVRGLPISIIFADFTLYALHSKVICKSISFSDSSPPCPQRVMRRSVSFLEKSEKLTCQFLFSVYFNYLIFSVNINIFKL